MGIFCDVVYSHLFSRFIQINQSKPECGRQTLVELLIRPVQRLPSVALLLNGNSHNYDWSCFYSLHLSESRSYK